ncbi:hypothetical protein M440DRAFT_1273982 [Trichoderma longibrachiatum ATCC 18648]|uniref:Uncharacterized protein n=1 Tax=Trichoderma longibrachiatum ATCC 18648 TaxID=983965 RepID=A0A2T4C1D4_TRILO|nr:hypothetical protein M440DRAFT_1273982 [Trichoderma longibrachiatum ATCC 18648]
MLSRKPSSLRTPFASLPGSFSCSTSSHSSPSLRDAMLADIDIGFVIQVPTGALLRSEPTYACWPCAVENDRAGAKDRRLESASWRAA